MLTVRQHLKRIKKTLSDVMQKGELVDITNYKTYSIEREENGYKKVIWTKAFEKALSENSAIYIPQGKYYLDSSLIVNSNTKIVADKRAEINLVKGTKVLMLRNKDVIDASYKSISHDIERTENISIEGGVWSEENTQRLGYGKTGAFDENDSLHGVSTMMLFSGVRNLSLRNMVFKNSAGFAVQVGRCQNFLIENVKFYNCFADGVHINGDTQNGVVYNVVGENEDDIVALNAYDWEDSTITNGAIENVSVSNIKVIGGHCKCMRILAGRLPEDKGGIDCSISNVKIKNVKGISTFKLYMQTPRYYDDNPDGTIVGRIENISFENIRLNKNAPSDTTPNYIEKDLVTGHFGVFELGNSISKLTLKNIKAVINNDKYPDTAHLITVGPKSYYIPEKNVEIFDPYVTSTVKEIKYKNVRVNGKKIKNLKEHIKEIEFDNLYHSKYSSGYGKVEKVTRI